MYLLDTEICVKNLNVHIYDVCVYVQDCSSELLAKLKKSFKLQDFLVAPTSVSYSSFLIENRFSFLVSLLDVIFDLSFTACVTAQKAKELFIS